MKFEAKLEQGEILDNRQLQDLFGCSAQGGMRRAKRTNTLILISNHVESVYDDRWIDEVFHYTGMGLQGDQSLDFMQNRTLAESRTNGVDVHLFEVFREREYTYAGRVILAGEPYREIQKDQDGRTRYVWMFKLKLADAPVPEISKTVIDENTEHKIRIARRLTTEELKSRAAEAKGKAGSRTIASKQYDRNIWVSEYVKRTAQGICQLCQEEAPFKDLSGKPYLETHHIVWLAKGGEDTIENTVALCPNCHRKMHILDQSSDREILMRPVGLR